MAEEDVLAPKKKKLPLATKIAMGVGGAIGVIFLLLSFSGSDDEFTPQSNVAPTAQVKADVAGGKKDPRFSELETKYNEQRAAEAKEKGFSTIDTMPQLELIGFEDVKPKEEAETKTIPPIQVDRYNPNASRERQQMDAELRRESEADSQRKEQRMQAKLDAMRDLEAGMMIASHQQYEVIGYDPVDGGAGGDDPISPEDPALAGNPIPVGTLMYASLDTPINSDEPSPVRATIVSGPMAGAVMIGGYDRVGEKVLISFDMLSFKGNSIGISAIAIDPNTRRTAIASHVEKRTLSRWGAVIGSALFGSFTDSVANGNTSITINGTSTTATQEEFSSADQAKIALGEIGDRTEPMAEEYFNRPPTVYVNDEKHPAVGIMFMAETRAEWVPEDIK